jgi:hypothetical protein
LERKGMPIPAITGDLSGPMRFSVGSRLCHRALRRCVARSVTNIGNSKTE